MISGLRDNALWRSLTVSAGRWRLLLLTTLLGTCTVLTGIGLFTSSGYLISRASQQPEILSLGTAIVGVRFFALARALLRYSERLASHNLAFHSLSDLRKRIFARLTPLVPADLPASRSSELLSRFVADVDRLQDLYLRGVVPLAIGLSASVLGLVVVGLLLAEAALVLAAALLLGGVALPLGIRAATRSAGRKQGPLRAQLTQDIDEAVTGGTELLLLGASEGFVERVQAVSDRLVGTQRRDAMALAAANGFGVFLSAGTAVAVTAVAIPSVVSGELNGVWLAAVALAAMGAYEAVLPLAATGSVVDSCHSAAVRVEEIVDKAASVVDPTNPVELDSCSSLRVSDLSFSYGGTDEVVLKGVNFELKRGEIVTITGSSGCGKSTLAQLLVRLRDPDSGSIELDDVDLRKLTQQRVREFVRLTPQDAHIFTTSIRDNVTVGNHHASDERIQVALNRVGLSAWVEGLPDGIKTVVGDQGAKLSGGQRVRIALARALVCDADFLVFDEPTAHLDSANTTRVFELIKELAAEGKGVVLVTHEPGNSVPGSQLINLGLATN